MRRFLIVLLMMVVGMAHARILHVGNDTIQLSQTKATTPALHVRVGDEVWYGNMTRCQLPMNENTDKELKIKYNDKEYWVSNHTGYVIQNGKLTDALCNVYLMGTGTQWIDTEHVPTLVTRSEIELKFSDDEYKASGGEAFFGIWDTPANSAYTVNFGGDQAQGRNVFPWICRWGGSGGPSWCRSFGGFSISTKQKTTKQTLILDAKNNYAQYGTASHDLQGRKTVETGAVTLFGRRTISKDGTESVPVYSRNNAMYIYSTKIYEDDVLVRHFVPVPRGLVIGDFVVPSNGMWDIVEQKFYGNMGSGEFIYGIDGE